MSRISACELNAIYTYLCLLAAALTFSSYGISSFLSTSDETVMAFALVFVFAQTSLKFVCQLTSFIAAAGKRKSSESEMVQETLSSSSLGNKYDNATISVTMCLPVHASLAVQELTAKSRARALASSTQKQFLLAPPEALYFCSKSMYSAVAVLSGAEHCGSPSPAKW